MEIQHFSPFSYGFPIYVPTTPTIFVASTEATNHSGRADVALGSAHANCTALLYQDLLWQTWWISSLKMVL
jgi:hypothetical protein